MFIYMFYVVWEWLGVSYNKKHYFAILSRSNHMLTATFTSTRRKRSFFNNAVTCTLYVTGHVFVGAMLHFIAERT